MRTDTRAQVRFTPKQVVFLFVAAAVMGVVIFLCGVLVGRGVPLAQVLNGETANVVALHTNEPPAVISTPRSEPATSALADANLTYYTRLDGATASESDRFGSVPAVSDATVLPADGPEPTLPIITPARDSGYTLQVSALRVRSAAELLAARLAEKGYAAFVASPFDGAPITTFSVRVGPYGSRLEAERALERLEREDAFNPWFTR